MGFQSEKRTPLVRVATVKVQIQISQSDECLLFLVRIHVPLLNVHVIYIVHILDYKKGIPSSRKSFALWYSRRLKKASLQFSSPPLRFKLSNETFALLRKILFDVTIVTFFNGSTILCYQKGRLLGIPVNSETFVIELFQSIKGRFANSCQQMDGKCYSALFLFYFLLNHDCL